ncbi:tyrosine-type recombinase/integrase [Thermodesulfobacteriota bacterium]
MKGSVYHDKKAQRWCVAIYWEGKRYRIWRHPLTGEPFWARRSAEKQLNRIRTEVDEGYFNPKHWMPDSPMSTRVYALEWLECINVSPNTLKDYRYSIKRFIIPFFGDKDLRRIRHNDLVKFHKWVPRADKGKYNVLSCLRTMLRYAYRNEDISRVPPFPKLSYELPEIEYIEIEQQEAILENIHEKDRPIFQFMMEYGVRPGEARALQKDSIKNSEVVIRRAFAENILRDTTKTGRIRRYPITSYFQKVLNGIEPHLSPFVFVRKDGKPYTGKNLNKIWHKACEKAGVKIKLYNGVRHSLGCQLLDMGYDMSLVQDQLGHTKQEMTRRYAKHSKKALADALEARRKGRVIELRTSSKRPVT